MGLKLPGRVQVAGVIDQAEAELLIEAGVEMLGFPLGLKDGREDLGVEKAAAIVREMSGKATPVCITYLETAAEIAALCDRLGARWVQLHGPVAKTEIIKLKAQDSDLGIIKSLIVKPGTEAQLLRQANDLESHVDAFITDTFDPESGRSGATGKTHNWEVSRKIVSSTEKPVILAGGLTPKNVAEAVATVRPAAVDAHTGLEGPDGRKDAGLVSAFVRRARQAFDEGTTTPDPYSPASNSRRDFAGTDWLAFRDIPALLDRHLDAEMRALPALDLGCGAGRSTRFLASLGFDVIGADINPAVLSLARRQQPQGEFRRLRGNELPWPTASFGLVLSSFALMEVESLERMRKLMGEVRRVLRPRGRSLMVINTPDFYRGSWLSCEVDFEHNKGTLRSGQKVRVRLVPEDIRIEDYFWTDENYCSVFEAAGLSVLERHLPLGRDDENAEWRDERHTAPFAVYVLGA